MTASIESSMVVSHYSLIARVNKQQDDVRHNYRYHPKLEKDGSAIRLLARLSTPQPRERGKKYEAMKLIT
jgi:hypothetical protein